MAKIKLEELPQEEIITNPGLVVGIGEGKFLIHDRTRKSWVLGKGYFCRGNFNGETNNYRLIEKLSDYLALGWNFGLKVFARSLFYRDRDAWLEESS